MLISYADESGHSADPACGFVGIGGLVAPAENWEKVFKPHWQAALDEFIQGEPFHMREFVVVPGLGRYRGWDESKRRAFMAQLVDAILKTEARPVGCVVSTEHFSMLRPEHQRALRDPYYIALQEVTKGLSLAAIPKDVPVVLEQVAMVYAHQEDFGATPFGRVEQLWRVIKAEAVWGQWMGTYSCARPQAVLPLQAADLFAYEITHEFETWIKRPQIKMRWPLKQILTNAKDQLLIKVFTLPAMIQCLAESGALQESTDFTLAAYGDFANVKSALLKRIEE
ncbi:MAG: hypothetical protein JO300_05920 [Silvibacterium sp.]|nr:hypothetical protein [Silvibacterium sp.]MBV8438785.1 hypothetical protein [Silvibacterium sp.]